MENKTDNKCNIKVESKYAYIEDKYIYIDDYIKDNTKCKIKCVNGHKLICINGKTRKAHFRHKNNDDVYDFKMTNWHCEWQSNFPIIEKSFQKITNKQIKDRRADVLLEKYNIVLEFQHSKIEYDEVNNRKNDYELNNLKIIWIIDGNNSIDVKKLNYCNRIFLEFYEKWIYKSFICYEYIFIDINGFIYKISPKNVKSDMIDVEQPIIKEDFIKYLNTNDKCITTIDIPLQCNLYIKQQGAGNGKTYGLIQMLESEEFEHYKYFIIVTKQHSAKEIIYNEFTNQIKEGHLKYLNIDEVIDENKKYKIIYTNKKTNSQCHVVVGTIDSLMYILGNKNHNELDKFEGIVNSIIDGYIEINDTKSIKYNGINIKFNKEVCLICDETQDLTIDYAKAIIQIMRNKYIDSYIVGDKLQSIMHENNAFTTLLDNDFPYINKKKYEPINICRRFSNSKLIEFVNNIVPFDKYLLSNIKPHEENKEKDETIVIFNGENIYANETSKILISNEVEKIMNYYDKEVNNNNYKPEDFLFITPFTTKNPLVNAIETAINIYWNTKNNNDNFKRYSIFHKSEDGKSIYLPESNNSTRLVSIHTSKGDGRNVVFVIGLDEQSLIKFSGESNNLIYESLIHVAFTRMKKKLFIRLVENNDDIYQRITKYAVDNNLESYRISYISSIIQKNIKYNNIIKLIKNNNDFEILKNNIINNCDKLKLLKVENKIIDMSHHTIRFASMIQYLFIKIIKHENKNKTSERKRQIFAKFIEVKKAKLYITENFKDYSDTLEQNKNNNVKQICILKFSTIGRDYKIYFDILYNFITNIQSKIEKILNDDAEILCPLESIILYYMLQICRHGVYTDITINDLYNIIDIYSKSFKNEFEGHNYCICKKYFTTNNNNVINDNKDKMNNYLSTHYEKINNIGIVYDKFLENFPKVNWLIDHQIYFNGNTNDFELKKNFNLIGYDNENVFIIYITPQFNELNYNDILIDSIFDTYLFNTLNNIYNTNLKPINCDKFGNKNIITILFTVDKDDYYTFEWKNNDKDLIIENKKIIINKIKDKINNKYKIESKYILNFYKYYKNIFTEQKLLPEKIINNIINELKKDPYYIKIPDFILKFFHTIENKIEDCNNKNEKLDIFNNYDNNKYFINKLNDTINKSIENFLGIEKDDNEQSNNNDDLSLIHTK